MATEHEIETSHTPFNVHEMLDLVSRTQQLTLQQVAAQIEEGPPESLDPLDLARPMTSLVWNWSQEPLQLAGVFGRYWQRHAMLNCNALLGLYGLKTEPVAEPVEDDRRFLDESWSVHPWFDHIKQSYLLFSDLVNDCFDMDTGLGEQDRHKIHFFTHQWLKAVAPSNYPPTNPVVIKEAVATDGASLVNGYRNFLRDWEQSNGQFRILLSDPDAFVLGENIATTPGKVVFQNDLFQLIQYLPTTEKTFKDPLLVIPPWINKYYIMDLRQDNSIIKYWVDQGHTVFVVSWINPDESHADISFEDYMLQGVYAACDAVEQATGEKRMNTVGYCIGGTLLAATLAHMKARGDDRIRSATFLTTLIDFSDPGEIRAFIDEKQVRSMESRMDKKGYLEGTEMASAFSMLRADDLIWNAVVHYYLMGKETIAFDLLHWNGDSTGCRRRCTVSTSAICTSTTCCASPAGLYWTVWRWISVTSTSRSISCPRTTTTSHPGQAPISGQGCFRVRCASWSAAQDTSPG